MAGSRLQRCGAERVPDDASVHDNAIAPYSTYGALERHLSAANEVPRLDAATPQRTTVASRGLVPAHLARRSPYHTLKPGALNELPPLVDPGLRDLVVETERRGQDQEQDERGARHRVAEELPAGLPWHEHVPRDVGRQQPEVNNGVTGEPEERSPCLMRSPQPEPQVGVHPGDDDQHQVDQDEEQGPSRMLVLVHS